MNRSIKWVVASNAFAAFALFGGPNQAAAQLGGPKSNLPVVIPDANPPPRPPLVSQAPGKKAGNTLSQRSKVANSSFTPASQRPRVAIPSLPPASKKVDLDRARLEELRRQMEEDRKMMEELRRRMEEQKELMRRMLEELKRQAENRARANGTITDP